jgi:hypothetical protein
VGLAEVVFAVRDEKNDPAVRVVTKLGLDFEQPLLCSGRVRYARNDGLELPMAALPTALARLTRVTMRFSRSQAR